MTAKIRESNAEHALLGRNEFGGGMYDLTRIPRPPETLPVKPDAACKRANGQVITAEQWEREREEAHNACAVRGSGEVTKAPSNIAFVLKLHPYWRGALRLNDMGRRYEYCGKQIPNSFGMDVAMWFQAAYWLTVRKAEAWEAIDWVCERNVYHPVAEYLGRLRWDGVSRIDELPERVGAKPQHLELYRTFFRKWLHAAVRRIYEPGVKFDNMLVLAGAQGIRKSSFLRSLAGAWFNDSIIQIDRPAEFELLNRAWIHEFAELESFTSKADLGRLKAFLSTETDNFRPVWERKHIDVPRRCVFAGTTNDFAFLRDPTGARRFWVIELERKIDVNWVQEHRDQLWAEARAMYTSTSETEWLEGEQVEEQIAVNELHGDEDPWTEVVNTFVDPLTWTTTRDILRHIGIQTERLETKDTRRVGTILRKLGWRSSSKIIDGRISRCWFPPRKTLL
jgi:putative DNA primase/helicase